MGPSAKLRYAVEILGNLAAYSTLKVPENPECDDDVRRQGKIEGCIQIGEACKAALEDMGATVTIKDNKVGIEFNSEDF